LPAPFRTQLAKTVNPAPRARLAGVLRWTTLLVGIAIISVGCQMQSNSGNQSQPQSSPAPQGQAQSAPAKQWGSPPTMRIDQDKQYEATISTSMGDMKVELLPKEAPTTVNNFVFLAREGFYENVKFHRIMRGFMVQTGDPTGTGAGGPGYRFIDEPVNLNYEKGIVAMANAGPNTNGSQFFIVHGDNVQLPKSYTIFGKVTDGLNVLDQIAAVPVSNSPRGEASVPQTDVRINKVTITER
jgi:cyclophilin family peptidyl-prolyl cis-trans isomerase